MARYIDVDKLKAYLHEDDFYDSDERWKPESEFSQMIDATPTANVEEVKWKAIDGYEGLYEVSTFGQVRNAKGQILKPYLKHEKYTSYKKVALWKDGKYKQFSIHRLVAQAFIPNENNLPIINHKDEDGTNNIVSNLEWCDRSYNAMYKNAPKRKSKSAKGKTIPTEQRIKISNSMKQTLRKNTKLKFEYNGEMLSIPELAEKLNIKPATLWMRYERTGSVFLGGAKMDGGKNENV